MSTRKTRSVTPGLVAELHEQLELRADVEARAPRTYPATVVGQTGADVFVELAPRVQGAVSAAEFETPPEPGAKLAVTLAGQEDGLWIFSVREARALASWEEMQVGSTVSGKVLGFNKGGLELKVAGASAFLPASQIALRPVEDLAAFAGQTLTCRVIEIEREKRRLTLSRRALLEAEAEAARAEGLGRLGAGKIVRGRVTRLESYGAFVDLGKGLEGLLHVSQLSHRRIGHPSEVLALGAEIEVQVLGIEQDGKRIALGRKALEADPWQDLAARFPPEHVFTAKVTRLAEFGAFAEVEPGLDGLVHVSQLAATRVRKPSDVVKVGDAIHVRVLSVDPAQRRIALSRLTSRGALLGSEEALESSELGAALERGPAAPLGTNLGGLFKKALDKKGGARS
jgi:ribosomal protein S1